MRILDAEQMRATDARASRKFAIPSLILMENAAIAVSAVLRESFPDAANIAVICGPGQNGGDGFAIARHLHNEGLAITIFTLAGAGERDAAATNIAICRALELPIEPADDSLSTRLAAADLIVDAMFGVGLSRPLEGSAAAAASAINGAGAPVLAVDVPSGARASSGVIEGEVVDADVTVALAAIKPCHVIEPASSRCGVVVAVDIGIPSEAFEEDCGFVIDEEFVAATIPPRESNTHKGTWGHVGIIAGSSGRSGAAILAARGALRAGAGLVTVFTDETTARIVDTVSVESMSADIDWDDVDGIARSVEGRDAILIGSGLPDDDGSWQRIRALVARIAAPLVADAGAINAFAGDPEGLRGTGIRVLTPHPGELARLLGRSTAAVASDRLAAAAEAAERTGCIVVLKGSGTIVAAPDGKIGVNVTGTPAMGSGGTGDVLAGVVTALLARGLDAFDAACAAVWLHGTAGEVVSERIGDSGLAAMELADALPAALLRARREEND